MALILNFQVCTIPTNFSYVSVTFVGLNVGYEDRQHDYDTVEDRYQKLKHNCSRMNTFQVGIAAFIWNEAEQVYTCRPFNFYVFKDSTIYDSTVLQFQVRASVSDSLHRRVA